MSLLKEFIRDDDDDVRMEGMDEMDESDEGNSEMGFSKGGESGRPGGVASDMLDGFFCCCCCCC
jgi:hypothetical protein